MTNTTEDFVVNDIFTLLPKFGTNLLTLPIFVPYSSAILEKYFHNIF